MKAEEKIIEDLMHQFRPIIAQDYNRYKNHVIRVFSNCLLLDDDKDNVEKYAIAAAYHDIGIWTDKTIDYLDPSICQAKYYLAAIGKPEWTEEIALMIHWHHKTSAYKGTHQKIVETFRRADWIDVSLGLFSFGIAKKDIRSIKKHYANLGFHWFLVKQIMANWIRNPLNPLPMFTK